MKNIEIDDDFTGGFTAALVALANVLLRLQKSGVLTPEARREILSATTAEGERLVEGE